METRGLKEHTIQSGTDNKWTVFTFIWNVACVLPWAELKKKAKSRILLSKNFMNPWHPSVYTLLCNSCVKVKVYTEYKRNFNQGIMKTFDFQV